MGVHQHPERPEGENPINNGPVDTEILEFASHELLEMIDKGSKSSDFVSVPSAGIAVPAGQMLRILKRGLELSLPKDVDVESGTRMMEAQLAIVIQLAHIAVAVGTVRALQPEDDNDAAD